MSVIVGAAIDTGTSVVSMPAHRVGDLILVFAFRNASTTVPTKPAPADQPPWQDITAGVGANTCSARTAWAIATTTTMGSGVWTNATSVGVIVIRGANRINPIGASAAAGGTAANSAVAPASNPWLADATSQLIQFLGHRTATAWAAAPAGYTGQASTTESAVFSKNDSTSDGSQAFTNTATSSGYWGVQIEVIDEETPFPLTGILDNFNRADGPLGANWTASIETGQPLPSISSNQVVIAASSSAMWNPSSFGANQEAFCAVSGLGKVALWTRLARNGGSPTGYWMLLDSGGTRLTLSKVVGDGFAQIGNQVTVGSGVLRFGVRVSGSVIKAFVDKGGGYYPTAAWVDTTITVGGNIGFWSDIVNLDDFGGGTYTPLWSEVAGVADAGFGAVSVGSNPQTFDGAVATGDVICVNSQRAAASDNLASDTCADDLGNAYTLLDHGWDSANGQGYSTFGCIATHAGTPTVTVTYPVSSTFSSVQAQAWRSTAGAALLDVHGGDSTPTTIVSGSFDNAVAPTKTPTYDSSLVVAFFNDTSDSQFFEPGTDYTQARNSGSADGTGGNGSFAAIEFRILDVGTAGIAVTPTGDISSTGAKIMGATAIFAVVTVPVSSAALSVAIEAPRKLRGGLSVLEYLVPDAILEEANLSGAVGLIQDDPVSPDGNWLAATDPTVNTALRVSFGTPALGLGNTQTVQALVRATSAGNSPTVQLDIYEGGVLIQAGTPTVVTSTVGQLVSTSFALSLLADQSGANVEARLIGLAD
jgi:hypothetical protein